MPICPVGHCLRVAESAQRCQGNQDVRLFQSTKWARSGYPRGKRLAGVDQRQSQPRDTGFVRSLFKMQKGSRAALWSQVGAKAGN